MSGKYKWLTVGCSLQIGGKKFPSLPFLCDWPITYHDLQLGSIWEFREDHQSHHTTHSNDLFVCWRRELCQLWRSIGRLIDWPAHPPGSNYKIWLSAIFQVRKRGFLESHCSKQVISEMRITWEASYTSPPRPHRRLSPTCRDSVNLRWICIFTQHSQEILIFEV